jgi:hypothetical protein
VSASAAIAPMSAGSIVAIGTDPNGPRTTSPDASCGTHSRALLMNELGCSTVHSTPEACTIRSDSIW